MSFLTCRTLDTHLFDVHEITNLTKRAVTTSGATGMRPTGMALKA